MSILFTFKAKSMSTVTKNVLGHHWGIINYKFTSRGRAVF